MITASKRMLNSIEENQTSNNVSKKSWSINNRFETIVLGDAYCGKSSYLRALVEAEKKSNAPVMISQDQSEYEFWIEYKSMKAIFKVKDTASEANICESDLFDLGLIHLFNQRPRAIQKPHAKLLQKG